MKLHRRKRRGFEDTSASSDVAFLLIIYFIVIAGFNVNKGFLMTLPAKDSTRLILKDDLLRFDVDGRGNLFHQGTPMDRGVAEREIRGAIAAHPNLAVLLTVDAAAPWQAVVSFVEVAQKLNVESFSFTIKKPDGGSP
jgi:biopolymer transport protein ExbD